MIDRDHQLPITRQARLLGMSRGAVYYLPRPVSAADLALMLKIDKLHLEHPFMGARMLRDQPGPVRASTLASVTSERSCSAWASKPWPRSRAPANGRRATRYTPTCCCASCLSCAPTRCGRWTRPTSRWPGVCVSHRSGGRGQPPGAGAQGGDHAGGLSCQRSHRRGLCPLWHARYRQHRFKSSQFTATEFTDAVLARGCKLSMDGRGAWRDRRLCRTRLAQCEV